MTVSAASALNVTGTDTDASDYTTASWTPTAGKTYIAAVLVYDADAAASAAVTCTGNGITWNVLASNGGNTVRLTTWRGVATSSASAGTLTFGSVVSSGTADGAAWGIVELSGVRTSSNIVQTGEAAGASDSISVTLSAFAKSTNATGAWVSSYDNASTTGPAITAGSGFSIVTGLNAGQAAGGDGLRLAFEFKDTNDTGVDATAVAANDAMRMHAYEINEGIDADATAASGTGTGYGATTQVAPTGGTIAATGTPYGATTQVAPTGAAATGTGAAYDGSASVAPTGVTATGTGTAYDATVTTEGGGTNANAEVATATGTAYDGSASVAPTGVAATATGAAYDATTKIAPTGVTATATGTTYDGSASVAPTGVTATGTGTAYDATVVSGTIANAEVAAGTGTAYDGSVAIAPTGITATATGTAYDATVTTGTTPTVTEEEERFGGAPINVRDLRDKEWEEQLDRLLREDEEILCLV